MAQRMFALPRWTLNIIPPMDEKPFEFCPRIILHGLWRTMLFVNILVCSLEKSAHNGVLAFNHIQEGLFPFRDKNQDMPQRDNEKVVQREKHQHDFESHSCTSKDTKEEILLAPQCCTDEFEGNGTEEGDECEHARAERRVHWCI